MKKLTLSYCFVTQGIEPTSGLVLIGGFGKEQISDIAMPKISTNFCSNP